MAGDDDKAFDVTITDNDNNINKILNHIDLNHVNNVKKSSGKDLDMDLETSDEVVRILRKQLGCLETVHDYYGERLKLEYVMEDWKKMAQVVDRIFMVLFFIFQLSTTLAILIRISTASPDIHYE